MKLILILSALFFLQLTSLDQTHSVTGQVTNMENGNPILCETILLKGSSNETSANADEKFSITSPKAGTLIFSGIEFCAEELPVENCSVINVTLDPNVGAWDDVVAIDYGKQKKLNVIGSAFSVQRNKERS